MTRFFVNLPLSYNLTQPDTFDFFRHNAISPELGLDLLTLEVYSTAHHKITAGKFEHQKLKTAVHMPFIDLKPGSPDNYIHEASIRRLKEAVAFAKLYSPEHIIAHTGYVPNVYNGHYSRWIENSLIAWRAILDEAGDIPVYLENVYEQDPTEIGDLLSELGGRAGFCFDLGHWFSFGGGKKGGDLTSWLQGLGPYLRHLHLHDNDGLHDEHLGLGTGKIPFVELFAGLELLDLCPGFTLEPHSPYDFEKSLEFICQRQYWFSLLGFKKNDFDHIHRLKSRVQTLR